MQNYVDFDFYANDYSGDLQYDAFKKCVVKAGSLVRKITFGRAAADNESVKYATCAACDVYANATGRTVISENTDGYSASYLNEGDSGETQESIIDRKAIAAAELYLDQELLSWEV